MMPTTHERQIAGGATVAVGATSGVRSEFYRYVVVGGLSTVCDASTLFSLTRFAGVHYLVSAPIGFCIGTIVNYFLSGSWVFERRTMNNRSAELTIFTLIGLVGLLLNELILWFFQSK